MIWMMATVAAPEGARHFVARADARRLPAATFVALRPRQWTKNLLLFAGIIFAAKLGDMGRWFDALAGFAAYCAASSAAYLINDVRDAVNDRSHPVKRFRPIARGELSTRTAYVLAALLAAGAAAIVLPLGLVPFAFLVSFVLLQVAYTVRLK